MDQPRPGVPALNQRQHVPTVLVPTERSAQSPEVDAIEVSELARLLRRHARFILTIAAVSFGVGMAWTLFGHMRFAATARLYLGELEAKNRPNASSEDGIDLSAGGYEDMASELEIIKSRSLVTRAVLDSGLNVTVTLPGWQPPRYFRWLASLRSVRLLDVAAKELAAVDTLLSDRFAPPATFDVSFVSDVDYEVRQAGGLVCRGKVRDQVQCDSLSVRLVPGTDRGPRAGARYQVEVEPIDRVVESALKSLEVSAPTSKGPSGAETGKIVNLYFSDRSPRRAATFLENLMAGYLEVRHGWKTQNATAAEAFVASELNKTRDTLNDLQNKLASYRAQHDVVVMEGKASGMMGQLGQYEEQRVAAQLEVDSLYSLNEQLKEPKPSVEAHMVGEAKDDSVLIGLAASLSQSRQRLSEAQTRYNAPAPEVQNLQAQVDTELQHIRSYVKTRLMRARQNLRMLDGIVAQYEAKLRTVPSAEVGLAQLTRETEVYSAMYSRLLKQQQESALVKASTISRNRVIDPPQAPHREEMQRLGIGLASAPLGLVLGAILVLIRSLVSGRLQHTADARKHLGGIRVLATIPHIAKGDHLSLECAEAFRTLRANVYHVCQRDQGNVVLFTSPCSRDGKTTCAFFLASILARSGRSVLLVDTGLKPETKEEPESGAKDVGIVDVLTGGVRWRDVIREIQISDQCVFQAIRRGGRGESNDVLSSSAMFQFVDETRKLYDFILIEAPSYPAVSDTFVLCGLADCVVAVVRIEHTLRALAADNVRQMALSTSSYGIVVNDVTA